MRRTVATSALTFAAALAACAGFAVTASAVSYDSVADDLGILFQQAGEVHGDEPGEDIDAAFPEVIGGGACMSDFDGDGLDDLYLVSQQYNPNNDATEGWIDDVHPANRLYINQGDGTFEDATDEAGVGGGTFGYGCSAADYDGDGFTDLFVTSFGDEHWGGNLLFHNKGDGTFDEVATEAGVSMFGECGDVPCMSTNSAWGDYDNDGDLDLYVGNYVESSLDDDNHGPQLHLSQVNWLFANNGDGTFTERAEEAGVQGDVLDEGGSKTFAVVFFDYDLDGDLDIYVANDSEPNDFYENNGDGTFADRALQAGVDDPRASMGLAIADYDGDAYPDLFMTHYVFQEYGFYRNLADGTFEDRSGEDGLASAGDNVGWGTAFVDVERDGDLDIFSVNGHTAFDPDNYAQPVYAWRSDPPQAGDPPWDREWVDMTDDLGPGVREESVGRGAAFGDFDLDGDTDIAINNNANESARFLRASGVTDHYLNVRLVQDGMNRHGIGAKVKLEAPGLSPQYREVQAGSSFLSQNTLTLEFGLGGASQAEGITITWPGGGSTVVENVSADQTIRIDRTTGTYVTDVISPLTSFDIAGDAGVDGWYRSAVTVGVSATDRGSTVVSGLALTEIALGEGPLAPFDSPLLFDAEGAYSVSARSTDNAGNVEPRRTAMIGVDLTAPTASHELEGTAGEHGWWVDEPVRVTFAGADALSGVREVRYRINGGEWAPDEGAVEVANDGEHFIEYQAIDRAGNEGAVESFLLRIDLVTPDASIASPGAGEVRVGATILVSTGTGPSIMVALPGEEIVEVLAEAADAASGVDRVIFLVDGNARSVDRDGPVWAWAWDLGGEATGLHELQVVAVDVAGNVRVVARDVVLIVTTAPAAGPAIETGTTLALLPWIALATALRRRELS